MSRSIFSRTNFSTSSGLAAISASRSSSESGWNDHRRYLLLGWNDDGSKCEGDNNLSLLFVRLLPGESLLRNAIIRISNPCIHQEKDNYQKFALNRLKPSIWFITSLQICIQIKCMEGVPNIPILWDAFALVIAHSFHVPISNTSFQVPVSKYQFPCISYLTFWTQPSLSS